METSSVDIDKLLSKNFFAKKYIYVCVCANDGLYNLEDSLHCSDKAIVMSPSLLIYAVPNCVM